MRLLLLPPPLLFSLPFPYTDREMDRLWLPSPPLFSVSDGPPSPPSFLSLLFHPTILPPTSLLLTVAVLCEEEGGGGGGEKGFAPCWLARSCDNESSVGRSVPSSLPLLGMATASRVERTIEVVDPLASAFLGRWEWDCHCWSSPPPPPPFLSRPSLAVGGAPPRAAASILSSYTDPLGTIDHEMERGR